MGRNAKDRAMMAIAHDRNEAGCSVVLLAACLLWAVARGAAAQPLASWNHGPAKQAIVKFVTDVTAQHDPTFVAPGERIAVFDNDGTLWSEQPFYFQFMFALDRIKAAAPEHPEWREREPFKSILAGYQAAGKKFKVHIDGYNLLPFLTEKGIRSPRKGFIYFDDDGELVAVRFDNWKVVFMEQRRTGTLAVWSEPFVPLRLPKLYNLRTDPFERADTTSNTYYDWFLSKSYMVAAAGAIVEDFLATFREYPPRQRAATFTIDQALEKMKSALSGAHH